MQSLALYDLIQLGRESIKCVIDDSLLHSGVHVNIDYVAYMSRLPNVLDTGPKERC